jgi:type II secretory pathway predicted ATPase ExeA
LALPRFPTRMLHLKSLGFSEDPFLPIPDPRFLFLSSQHAPLLERLFSFAERGHGLAVIDGDKGVGKSITARRLQSYYLAQPEEYNVAYLYGQALETEYAVLAAISDQFLLNRRKGIESQWEELANYLNAQMQEGRGAVVIIDHPPSLAKEALLQLNAVANQLLPAFLLGRQEIATILGKAPEATRSAYRYTLSNLSLEDTVEMIHFRCAVAGRSRPILTPEAIIYIWEATYGNPGDVINVCGRTIFALANHPQEQADLTIVTPITEAYLDSKIELTH